MYHFIYLWPAAQLYNSIVSLKNGNFSQKCESLVQKIYFTFILCVMNVRKIEKVLRIVDAVIALETFF